jgi:hypothetical protein
MSIMCGRCRLARECGEHPERFLDCQDNAARFDYAVRIDSTEFDSMTLIMDELKSHGLTAYREER